MNNKFFGWTGLYFPFVLLFSVILVLSVSVTNVMGAVYDDFNDDNINQTLWNMHDDGGILSQSGGLLHADGPPNSMYGHLISTYEFRGDFEFVLDYREFQTTATLFTGNCPQVSLQVTEGMNPEDNFLYIFRGYFESGHTVLLNGKINGSWQSGFSTSATSQAGLLKITRTGSTITTYYDEGTGWNPLGSFPEAFTGDVTIQIGSYSGDDGIFHVSSDWITYEGQILSSPVPDMQANGSDGPVTISQGDLLTVTASLDPGIQDGEDADWWVAATSPLGLYWFTLDSGWVRSDTPIRAYGGPLFTLFPYTILEMSTLPIGGYTFYFVVDMTMNGILDFSQLYHDGVEVNIE